jgi:hypothetical protein
MGSPVSRRLIAPRLWWSVSFGFRPILTPFALARSSCPPICRQGTESGSGLRNRVERVQQIVCRARQPVGASHHQHVAFGKLVEWSGAIGRGRSSRRSPSLERPCSLRRRAIASLACRGFGRRSILGHSRISWLTYARHFCTKKVVLDQRTRF